MVARIDREVFGCALHTPEPDACDSDGVLLALETARLLEAQGEIREAARWLGRAADEATKQGNEERVLLLAQAAADLTNTIEDDSATAVAPPSVTNSDVRGPKSMRVARRDSAPEARAASSAPPALSPAPFPKSDMPPMLAALLSSIPPFAARRSSSRPPCNAASALPATSPRVASTPTAPQSASESAANDVATAAADHPHTARAISIGAIRVSISGSIEGAKFSVERLEKGQSVPAGATEAMLVLTDGTDRSIETKINELVANPSPTKPGTER